MRATVVPVLLVALTAGCRVDGSGLGPEPTPIEDATSPPDAPVETGPSCTNGTRDGTESDVDCGGACGGCAVGKACASNADCASKACAGNKCVEAGCSNGAKDGDESDVDCGGACAKCVNGRACGKPQDCASGVCAAGTCAAPSCSDGLQNGDETDKDCGGPTCPKCKAGAQCTAPSDCESGFCDTTYCRWPKSCKAIRAMLATAPSGVYTIDPDGSGPRPEFSVYCDMTTDGGGWTFFAHVNGNWFATKLFETDIGVYRADRLDDDTTYSRGASILPFVEHTAMMITVDSADPATAAAGSKIVFFSYALGATAFNKGPVPCAGLSEGFSYRTTLAGPFVTGGSTDACDATRWHTRAAVTNKYIVAFNGANPLGTYWGSGMGGSDTFYHDAYLWVR